MAPTQLDDITRWLDGGGRGPFGRRSSRRDLTGAARAFVGAVGDLDRRSVKALSQRLASDAELRGAVQGLTETMRGLTSDAPTASRRAVRRASSSGRVRRVGAVVAALGIAALAARSLLRRRRADDPAAVFDAHISSNGNGAAASPAESEVSDKG